MKSTFLVLFTLVILLAPLARASSTHTTITYSNAFIFTTTAYCPAEYSSYISNYYTFINNMFFVHVGWSQLKSLIPCHPMTVIQYTRAPVTVTVTPTPKAPVFAPVKWPPRNMPVFISR